MGTLVGSGAHWIPIEDNAIRVEDTVLALTCSSSHKRHPKLQEISSYNRPVGQSWGHMDPCSFHIILYSQNINIKPTYQSISSLKINFPAWKKKEEINSSQLNNPWLNWMKLIYSSSPASLNVPELQVTYLSQLFVYL